MSRTLQMVIPAWSAGIQAPWMFPEASLPTWMAGLHAGMTMISLFMFRGERNLMNRFTGLAGIGGLIYVKVTILAEIKLKTGGTNHERRI